MKYLRACAKSTYYRIEIGYIAQQITVIVYPSHQPTHSDPHFTSPETRINTGFLPFVNFYGLPLTFTPAAADTLAHFFEDTGTKPSDYDQIVTGDLGQVGSRLNRELMAQKGYSLEENYTDCGLLLFNRQEQDVHAGGSGCGCSASVLCAHFLPMLERGEIRSLLFTPTGALMSPTSSQQGESIPGIAHALLLVSDP